ncbi:MAG: hypothetical protein GSR72_03765 [Desulfurococcales archaeon]|nr:hypothetical protein [Desulfurococcales archaeon]
MAWKLEKILVYASIGFVLLALVIILGYGLSQGPGYPWLANGSYAEYAANVSFQGLNLTYKIRLEMVNSSEDYARLLLVFSRTIPGSGEITTGTVDVYFYYSNETFVLDDLAPTSYNTTTITVNNKEYNCIVYTYKDNSGLLYLYVDQETYFPVRWVFKNAIGGYIDLVYNLTETNIEGLG